MATVRELDEKIKKTQAKIEKYRGYITMHEATIQDLQEEKRKLTGEKPQIAKRTPKKSTKRKAPALKKSVLKKPAKSKSKKEQPSLLEGVLDEVKKAGFDPGRLVDSLLGKK